MQKLLFELLIINSKWYSKMCHIDPDPACFLVQHLICHEHEPRAHEFPQIWI